MLCQLQHRTNLEDISWIYEPTPTHKHDHHPNVPHKVEEVYEAAQFLLQGYTSFTQNLITSNSPQQSQQPQSPSTIPANSTNTPVKTEDLSTLFTGFTKPIIEALQSTQHRSQPCADHFYKGKLECKLWRRTFYLQLSSCTSRHCCRKVQNKSRWQSSVTKWRICSNKYNQQIPMQSHQHMAQKEPKSVRSSNLIHTINKHILDRQKSPSSSVYQLTATNHIAVLEAELYNLWARRQNFSPYPNCTHAQIARNDNVEIEDD